MNQASLIQGDARHLPLKDETVQTCITSPPYWGLRDYGLEPQIWGGDPTHLHYFGTEIVTRDSGYHSGQKVRWNHRENGRKERQDLPDRADWERLAHSHGSPCECGPWVGSLGLEPTPELYVEHIVEVFREIKRVLKKDGTLWLNLGDSYCGSGFNDGTANPGISRSASRGQSHNLFSGRRARTADGLKPKDLVGIPWMVAFALRADGWWLRSDIIWAKNNPMPESVQDRPTRSHEYIFLLSKSSTYYYDHEAIREPATYAGPTGVGTTTSPHGQGFTRRSPEQEKARQDKQRGHSRRHAGFNGRWDQMSKEEQSALGRNKRSVWTVATQPFADAHFATFPVKLIEPCILAGSRPGDLVLDSFAGSGTVGVACLKHDRRFVGTELNPDYIEIAQRRLRKGSQGAMPL